MATSDYYTVTLSATGKQYKIPTDGVTDWRNSLSLYLRDLAGAVNAGGGGAHPGSGYGINVTDYGAVGNMTTDNASALDAATAAAIAIPPDRRRAIYFPPGIYRTTRPWNIPASLGIEIYGEGQWISQIYFDPTVPNTDGVVLNSSAKAYIHNLSILTSPTNPINRALLLDFNPVVEAASGLELHNFQICSNVAPGGYVTGVYFNGVYGNNSEVTYYNCDINGFSGQGIWLPGTQQVNHNAFNTVINGLWDLASPSSPGGIYGVRCEGGALNMFGGALSSCRNAGYYINQQTVPVNLVGVQSEHCYRFFTQTIATQPTTYPVPTSTARQTVNIIGCRLDADLSPFDPQGYIQYSGGGPLNVSNNTFNGGDGSQNGGGANGQMKLYVATGVQIKGVRFCDNDILTLGSANYEPMVLNQGSIYTSMDVEKHGNQYRSVSGTLAFRNEVLQQAPATQAFVLDAATNVVGEEGRDIWSFQSQGLVDNAAQATYTLKSGLPKWLDVRSFRAYLRNYAVHTGGADVFLKVGVTSGGDELLQEIKISDDSHGENAYLYGDSDTEAGTGMLGGRGFILDSTGGNATVYVTLRVSIGTIGNGSTSNLTRGITHFPVRYEITPRYIV